MKTRYKDITGQKFGDLTALYYAGNLKWTCKCICGNIKDIRGAALRRGTTKSCGCRRYRFPSKKTYGYLTIIKKLSKKKKNSASYYLCKCICGNKVERTLSSIKQSKNASCGCKRGYGDNHFTALVNRYHSQYIHTSKIKNIEFKLTRSEFEKYIFCICHYCGTKPSHEFKSNGYSTFILVNGIDRIDNSRGYETTNSVSCCKVCNYKKRDKTYASFLARIKKIYEYRKTCKIKI
jgi:hypothetical protein